MLLAGTKYRGEFEDSLRGNLCSIAAFWQDPMPNLRIPPSKWFGAGCALLDLTAWQHTSHLNHWQERLKNVIKEATGPQGAWFSMAETGRSIKRPCQIKSTHSGQPACVNLPSGKNKHLLASPSDPLNPEVLDSERNIILMIDEIHTLVGAGGTGDGGRQIASLLTLALGWAQVAVVQLMQPTS